jgi:hypothetical protein
LLCAKQAEDIEVASNSHAALEKYRQWRQIPEGMKAAWQAVGAARAKTFPAVCLAPHSRKHHAAADAHAAVKRRRTAPEIDARILPDSTVAVVATVEGRVGKLLKLHSPAKKTSAAASIIIKVSPSPSSSLGLSLSLSF